MPRTRPLRFARALVLAAGLLVALQGASTAWLAARGPLHRHAAPAPVLEDFRRVAATVVAAAWEASTSGDADGHRHAHAEGLRHHHAGFPTALPLDDGASAADPALDDGTGPQAPFLPWRSDGPCLAARNARDASTPRAAAPDVRSRAPAPPLRPPRTA